MPLIYGDRVKETSLTTGTGTLALGGPTVGFQSFAVGVGVGNETFYGIVNTADDSWEMGRGTVGPGTLSRDTVISSSNSNMLVNLVAGQKVVYTTIPSQFYANALDAVAHEAIDHTAAPLNLMTTTVHDGIDHSAAPFNLLPTANLPAEHALIDHTSAPFNLLNSTLHDVIDHTGAPFNLLTDPLHSSINHFSLITSVIPQVSPAERTAGTEVNLRSYSPLDVATMASIHGAAASGKLIQQVRVQLNTAVSVIATTPSDDTPPQFAEGQALLSAVITPTAVGNTLVCEWQGWGVLGGTPGVITWHMHENTTANAFAAGYHFLNYAPGQGGGMWNLRGFIEGGLSLVPTTINLRCGISGLFASCTINGQAGPSLGTSRTSSLVVSEIAP